ncbi:hypothetical protein [Paenibacillus sabinae]|uniref:Uncharacterized protein n=1 Tax=Paenibacillus sabinae T27 TaxID=1268072 RepID=X4ZXX8_9BACL|nr:hypothetical protein [Paenibacillus sabinae]AHV97058.1 hypothetical protein PSAB_10640 [Paenibacillus sabinae T27]
MSVRWVLPHLFKLQSAAIRWSDELTRSQYNEPVSHTDMDEAALQFRWMLHPSLGLPRQPFFLWKNRHPGGDLSTQELANLPGWEPLEVIGLPVDNSWRDTGYDLNDQGPINHLLSPIRAALQRLKLGAPRNGWTRLSLSNVPLPDWEPPEPEAYLDDLLKGRLLLGIQAMLRDLYNARDHDKYVVKEAEAYPGQLNPRLLLQQVKAAAGLHPPSRSEWHPLGLLLVGAGTDPLTALALGFGTARVPDGEVDDLYMVSVRHGLQVGNKEYEFELADVVTVNQHLPAPKAPTGLTARIIAHNRPQLLDDPVLENIGVSWDRSENPNYSFLPPGNTSHPAAYAVGRFGPESWRSEILLTRRPELVRGWLPFVASKPDQARPVIFTDHVVHPAANSDSHLIASSLGLKCSYAVAAQDIFGRWSPWTTTLFQGPDEPPQTPSVLSIKLDPSGAAVVDFSWDWSNRSPEFIELIGTYEDDPGSRLFMVHLQFGGYEQPESSGFEVIPLNSKRELAAGWGGAQDTDPSEPEVRFYRLSVTIPIHFAGQRYRFFQVQARGQCHNHHISIPDWNISPFSQPVGTAIYDPAPPPPPAVPEVPQWASLPDITGVSRAQLRWSGNSTIAGYVLYEATETTLLAALGLPGPDTSKPFTDRLAILRAANLSALRSAFRRVRKELIPAATPETVYEAALPRGSTVIHLYAVTAMSHNQVESPWPDNSKKFIAVAAPKLAVPAAPSLEATPLTMAERALVNLTIGLGQGVAAENVELYRTANEKLAANVDTMGPPIATLHVAGPEISFTDNTLTPGWRRVWYRAVAWSARDDQRGMIEARSPASSAVSFLLTPSSLPEVIDLRVNESGSSNSEVWISWTSHAPETVTPLGPHNIVLETCDADGSVIARAEERLDAVTDVDNLSNLPPVEPGGWAIVRVGEAGSYRIYARLPRPAVDQAFSVTVKIIDPLGRIGSVSADVPPFTRDL